jgi:hypothetical protein
MPNDEVSHELPDRRREYGALALLAVGPASLVLTTFYFAHISADFGRSINTYIWTIAYGPMIASLLGLVLAATSSRWSRRQKLVIQTIPAVWYVGLLASAPDAACTLNEVEPVSCGVQPIESLAEVVAYATATVCVVIGLWLRRRALLAPGHREDLERRRMRDAEA